MEMNGAIEVFGVEGGLPDQFEIGTIRRDELKDVLWLNARIFTQQNDFVKFLDISEEDWHRLEKHDVGEKGMERISLVVRDKASRGQVVAFLLASTFGQFTQDPPDPYKMGLQEPEKVKQFFLFFQPLWMAAYMKTLYSGCIAGHAGRIARVASGGTLAGYEGKGLQGRLRKAFLKLVEDCGYDRVVVETISPATEHMWRDKFGFQVRSSASFKDFTAKDGTHPYKDVPGGATIQEKVLRKRPQDLACCCPFIGCCMVCSLICPVDCLRCLH